MLCITAHNLHWHVPESPEADLCAHGGVTVSSGDALLLDHRTESWTLSAGALMLLRTLGRNHNKESRVAEHLFPHCAHAMFVDEQSDDVEIIECPSGLDWSVEHRGDSVELRFPDLARVTLPSHEWRAAVLQFSTQVHRFYVSSAPKRLPKDEADLAGFQRFQAEWVRRHEAARKQSPSNLAGTGSAALEAAIDIIGFLGHLS